MIEPWSGERRRGWFAFLVFITVTSMSTVSWMIPSMADEAMIAGSSFMEIGFAIGQRFLSPLSRA